MTPRRAAALLALLLIPGMYLVTLVLALMDHPLTGSFLMASLFCSIVVPVFLYAFLLVIRYLKHRGEEGGKDGPGT